MHELARRPLDDLQFDEELEEIYQSSHIADFTEVLYPEVKEILRWLKEQGLQIALASSSPVHCISQMLDLSDHHEQAWKKAGRVSDRGGFYLWDRGRRGSRSCGCGEKR